MPPAVLSKSFDKLTDHPPTYSLPPMTNPETPSTAPVAWCRSDDFLNALLKQQSFSGWRERRPDCDMALYAQPQASAAQPTGPSLEEVGTLIAWLGEKAIQAADTGASEDAGMLTWAAQVVGERVDEDAPDADRAEGPSLADVAELCAEFEYHIDSEDDDSIGILRDMITAAITRWRAPAAEPVAAQDTEVDLESMTARMDFGMAKPSKPAWNQHKAWQPIETAPRDGTEILAWDGIGMKFAWRYEGRWIYDIDMESPYLTPWHPTHWQPLPSPPPITP